MNKALREAYKSALAPADIDRVLLEGGSSSAPWVREALVDIFGDENKIYVSEKPAFDISLGATYYAAMKMGILSEPDMESEKLSVEFDVTVPHDIGLEVALPSGELTFFPMIKRGASYSLAKRSHVFVLRGGAEEDMTVFNLKILERINKEDTIADCRAVGEVEITGLPRRPSGKTRLRITLKVEEEGGLIKGGVEDLGFGDEYAPSGYKTDFDPSRFRKTILEGSLRATWE